MTRAGELFTSVSTDDIFDNFDDFLDEAAKRPDLTEKYLQEEKTKRLLRRWNE